MDLRIRPAEGSRFTLTVEKTGLYRGKKHLFVFERYEGLARYDPAHPEQAQVQFEVEASSAVLMDDWVSPKDKKKILEFTLKDMLDAAHHPKIRFASSRIERTGEMQFRADGMLTLRGISKPVEVRVALREASTVLDGTAIVKITDYGLKPPSAALGTIGTKDQMTVSFSLRAAKALE